MKPFLCLLILASCFLTQKTRAADFYTGPLPEFRVVGSTNEFERFMRETLNYQSQLQSLQRELQLKRVEAEQAAQRNAEALTARITLMEQNLALQRQRETDAWERMNRLVMILSGLLALTVVAGISLIVWSHSRTVRTLAGLTEALRPMGALAAARSPTGFLSQIGPDPVEQTNTEFLSRLERLQKRLQDVERNVVPGTPSHANGHTQAHDNGPTITVSSAKTPETLARSESSNAPLLLAKGDTFLKMDQPEKALLCFDEALKNDPKSIDACVKRGQALEAAWRFDEALESYDRALSLDGSLTTVYLLKGAVLNRLKQFSEALACYDLALRPPSRSGASLGTPS